MKGATENMQTTGIAFTDLKEGDRLHFETRDTGFGGMGLLYRVGTVTKVTGKAVTLECEWVPGFSTTARIRRADFGQRCLGKVVED